MSKKTRTILFLICLFLFFSSAPLVILYSQGYRFDLNPPAGGIKFTQTGGLFIKTEPKQVEIYVNNELTKKTDFFFGSALIENLLPKRYKIEVKKEKYLTWEKNLEIREKEVTEAKNIILFPKNINFTILTERAEKFWFSPDEKKIILLEEDKSSSHPSLPKENSELGENEDGWTLKLYDLERNIKSHLISEIEFFQKGADLLNLEFSEDSKEIYLDIEVAEASPLLPPRSTSPRSAIEEQEKTFILKLDKLPPQLVEKKIAPSPENIITSKKYNQDIYYLDSSGYFLKNELTINEIPFPIKTETEYAIEIFSDFIFLIAENQTLYLFSPESKSFEIFFDKMSGLKISPDKRKLSFFSNSEIWILFLKDGGTKKAGEKLFLVRLSEKINNVFWLNSDYLIFNSGNNLKITEIDERDRIQVWDITSTPSFETEIKIYSNANSKNLYILSEEKFFISEKIF